MPSEDRLTALLEQVEKRVTGIDFVRVRDPHDQRVLEVYFYLDPEDLRAGSRFSEDPIEPQQIHIESLSGGERLAKAVVTGVANAVGERGRHILEVTVEEPGDFSLYALFIDDPRIDRFFNRIPFSFKQGCGSDFDCEGRAPDCPLEAWVDFPIDYLARDFVSLRGALLDFVAQRYPAWSERIEADAGVMLLELQAALGDELAYIQDRYAREAHFATASQRRSLRRHARLVDYEIHDGLSARTLLDMTAKERADGGGAVVRAGERVWGPALDGLAPVTFEVGEGLGDRRAENGGPRTVWVHEEWNAMPVHMPDAGVECLPVGATEVYLTGRYPKIVELPPGEGASFWVGKWMVLRSDPEDPAAPARRHLVRVVEVENTTDPLSLDPSGDPIEITRLRWEDAQALPFEMRLPDMTVHANIVPATAGETIDELFAIDTNERVPEALRGVAPVAVERQGPYNAATRERTVTFLHSLRATESGGLAWVLKPEAERAALQLADPTPDAALRDALPEIELHEVDPEDLSERSAWIWRRRALDAPGFERSFTLDDGTWRRVIGFRREGEVIEHADYASGAGFTIRFGDGEFGRIPATGTVFKARYRTGPGARANLPPDSVVHLERPLTQPAESDLSDRIEAVTNPFAIDSGVDPERAELVKHLAPEAFRAVTHRAVRPEDYREIAERLPWVQRAGATARWTGSWLTTFVTADPLGAFELSPERRAELEELMDCVRQAGREVVVRDPEFLSLDLTISICVEPFAYAGQVKERVIEALVGKRGPRPQKGFFHPDHFTFGTPLRRSALEAAVQAVPGVRSVEKIFLRARGLTDLRELTELVFEPGANRVFRLENDPRYPERGSLRITTVDEGGA